MVDDPVAVPRLLFLDPEALSEAVGVRLAIQPPRREIVHAERKAWDRMTGLYLTVLDEGSRLRLWYGCRANREHQGVALLESADGVNWERPNLDLVEFEGSRSNNLTTLDSMAGTVFRDPHAPAGLPYAYVANCFGEGLFVYRSADGARWTRDARPLLEFEFDSQNVAMWDQLSGQYLLFLRAWLEGLKSVRRRKVACLTAARIDAPLDLSPKSGRRQPGMVRKPHLVDEAPLVFACDERDPPETDAYTMVPLRYPLDPRYWLSFPTLYRHFAEPESEPFRNDGRTEVHFAAGTDPLRWQRFDRAAYAAPRTGECMQYMGQGMVVRGDECWQYGIAFRTSHGDVEGRHAAGDGVICRFVQRIDGFVAAEAGDSEGLMVTKPVPCSGGRLLLNIDTGGLGDARVELRDESGRPLEGFGFDACADLRANATGLLVVWTTGAKLAALRGRSVRLAVRMRQSKLYSARFED